MLTSFKVTGLWGHQEYPFDFHEDLNIITGSNGTGKTTLLKLIWYMLSGHLKHAFLEVNFARAELVTKTAIITLQKRKAIKQDNHPIDGSSIEPGTPVALVHMKRLNGDNIFSRYAMPMTELDILWNTQAPSTTLPSLFFPTFRRVEGGFSFNEGNEALKIVEGFKDFSKRMRHQHHQMIAFADFDDARALINETSSDIRAKLQPEEDAFMAFISSITKSSNGLPNTQELQHRAARLEQRRRELGRPLGLLSRYIDEYFLKKSVGVTDEQYNYPTATEGMMSVVKENYLLVLRGKYLFLLVSRIVKDRQPGVLVGEIKEKHLWEDAIIQGLQTEGSNCRRIASIFQNAAL